MAWVNYQRVVDGSSLSGKFGETATAVERWQIRVDSPATGKGEILGGVATTIGVTWGTPHWELSALKAMEFDLQPEGRDGLRWMLTVRYYTPPAKKIPKENGIPEDAWERSGGTTTVPCYLDVNGETITNSAKDPLEGLEREREESSWTLTKHYEDDATLQADVDGYAGKVNSSPWAGGLEQTWKCYFKSAKRVTVTKLDGTEDGGFLHYIESHWEFRYDPLTWIFKPWDVGFMEIVSGERKAILGDDGKPVKQPVALNPDGTKKPAGTAPSVINDGDGVEVYDSAAFAAAFGDPQLMPPA